MTTELAVTKDEFKNMICAFMRASDAPVWNAAALTYAMFRKKSKSPEYRRVLACLHELEEQEGCVASVCWRGQTNVTVWWLVERLLTREETP